jgi:hypothetical protein
VRTILFFLKPDRTRIAPEIDGPSVVVDEVLIAYRRWLGYATPAS